MSTEFMKNGNWSKNDEIYTPKILVDPILHYIKPNSKIWCPFDKDNSEYVIAFKEAGHRVIATHIEDGEDFFKLNIDCDYIISNPPFSRKIEVFERLFKLGIPFAMVTNMSALQYHSVSNFFYRYQCLGFETQLLLVDKKVSFNGNTSMFNSSYVCWRMLPKSLIYYHLEHNNAGKHFVRSRMKLREET